ncbi:hypothetical protein [Nitrolancea hollandica]|uniref:Uncharacterized protein n=1 Tax=Nitrolancea hollandica Lb TaxID=1129897 RepID=I4EGL3_9BACT|nr:hypothetical protein [Nitrolancea hollandica]CCF83825.1 conserved membrane hypothetical protein [Nitrolancea hollandica Lb]
MSPSLVLSIVLASIYGLLFHSLAGRRLWQLPCFWLSAVIGFTGGEILAVLAGAELFRVGSIPLLAASAGAFFGLLVCWFFTSPLPEPRTRRRPARR